MNTQSELFGNADNTKNTLKLSTFEENEIRVVMIDGVPHLVGCDVAYATRRQRRWGMQTQLTLLRRIAMGR